MMLRPFRPFIRALAALCFVATLAGCQVALYSNLTESEANQIVAALSVDEIGAAKERVDGGQWQVSVEERQLARALELLRAQGLPQERFSSLGDVFQKQGLVSTPAEERMRYIHAVSQELSQTLRNIDGVVAARVHVVVPANDPLADKLRPSSAAVFIKHRPDTDLRLLGPAVKDMVAHSIEGLTHEQVSLSLFETRRVAVADPAPAAAAGPEPLLSQRVVIVLTVLLVLAALSVAALPMLLKREGLEWRTWVRRQWLRR
jgi:type III secretion protein J